MTSLAIGGGLTQRMVIGIISGMIGIGGGAFLIPALIFFYGMSQKTAQGTSVATLLLPIGIFAFCAYYKAGLVDLKLALLIAIGFAVGARSSRLPSLSGPQTELRRTATGTSALLDSPQACQI